MPEKGSWVNQMISNSVNPSLQERVMVIFDRYPDFCYAYLKFNNKYDLASKIKNNRHYFTRCARSLKKKSLADENLYWLIKANTQFILRLCLLAEVGIDLKGLELIFFLEKMVETRDSRENEEKSREREKEKTKESN
jgi:ApeA N-terminal domain 1